jgi:2-polyprenyl-3-methyl-5-hydroxy-6-metoxy-1,4-benzoquinol methylase
LCGFGKNIVREILIKDKLITCYKHLNVNATQYFPEDTIYLYQCVNCHLLFFSPALEGDKLFYHALSNGTYYMEDKFEFEYGLNTILKLKPETVLEVGCGAGFFLEKIHHAFEVRGTEQNPAAIVELNKKGILLDDGQREYNFVVAFQVIEHVQDVKAFLDWIILEKLKPGGHLLLTMPNVDSVYMKEVFQILDYPPHHLTRWPKQTLVFLADLFNLEVIDYFEEPILPVHYRQLVLERRKKWNQDINDKNYGNLIQTIENCAIPHLLNLIHIPGHTHGILMKKNLAST